jgi:hypothetical protein
VVISRRALLGTGAATVAVAAGLGGAALGHRLDDLARSVGIEPHPEPDPGDDRLIARVAADQNALLAQVEATAVKHPALRLDKFVAISTAHAKAVGVADTVPDVAAPPAARDKAVSALVAAYSTASKARAADSVKAVSPALARVLASMSAGLAQCALTIGDLR